MDKIFAPKLTTGDTIGFLSVSGDIKDYARLEKAKDFFEQKGYRVVISDTAKTRKNYLCADDTTRANALNDFFADENIKAIIACRGGYGAIRLLDKIDYDIIKNNPKIFCGYSDITALELMIYKKTGLVTYNAPMAYSDFGSDIDDFSTKSFFDTLQTGIKEITLNSSTVFYDGICSGVLWGGNLSTIQSLCGLDFLPEENFIFIAEDINEPVYKIDKMFTQLLNMPVFKNRLKGIVLGDFSGLDNEKYFQDFFKELSQGLKIPTTTGLKFGHEKQKLTFPIGANAVLDTNLSKITFI